MVRVLLRVSTEMRDANGSGSDENLVSPILKPSTKSGFSSKTGSNLEPGEVPVPG